MLVEADPRLFLREEMFPDKDAVLSDTPVLLLNRAWQMHIADLKSYAKCEEQAVRAFL